jgi:hypothetical protein
LPGAKDEIALTSACELSNERNAPVERDFPAESIFLLTVLMKLCAAQVAACTGAAGEIKNDDPEQNANPKQ